jgi:hypothetical protein
MLKFNVEDLNACQDEPLGFKELSTELKRKKKRLA